LLIATKIENLANQLKIFAYNAAEDNNKAHLFVHHDIMLNKMPLSFAVMKNNTTERSHVAIGAIDQTIQIWDLDELDPIEPSTVLEDCFKNELKTKVKIIRNLNQHDSDYSINCLECNYHYCHNGLVSGSTDGLIRFWDVTKQNCTERLNHHHQKVSLTTWNPQNASLLLTGAHDRTITILDVRLPGLLAAYRQVTSEVEAGLWNPFDPTTIIVSTNDGLVTSIDLRAIGNMGSLFQFHAHKERTNNLALSALNPGVLATYGAEKIIKLWDVTKYSPKILASLSFGHGPCSSLEFCPSHPYVIAASDNTGNVSVWELTF